MFRAEEARLQALLQQLTEANAKLSAVVSEESKWVTQPISEHIKPLAVGPLTREDEEYLENELGAMLGGSSLDEGASSMRHQQQHAPSTSATGAPDQQASSSAPPAGAEASTPGPGVEPSAMSATTGGPASEAASPEPS